MNSSDLIQLFCETLDLNLLEQLPIEHLYIFYKYSKISISKNIGRLDIASIIVPYYDNIKLNIKVNNHINTYNKNGGISSYLNESDLTIYKNLIDKCIEDIKDNLDIRPPIKIYGKTVHQNRDVSFFSDESKGYYYSNQLRPSKPLTKNLKLLVDIINNYHTSSFNGILINRYNTGEETIGPHSDSEEGLDPNGGVVSISVGTIRKFRIRSKKKDLLYSINNDSKQYSIKSKKIIKDVFTLPYHSIKMAGNFQKEFTHEIPKEKTKDGVRYSFTFRKHNK